jgi:hypothetical protein
MPAIGSVPPAAAAFELSSGVHSAAAIDKIIAATADNFNTVLNRDLLTLLFIFPPENVRRICRTCYVSDYKPAVLRKS